jgi:hypothetical protein
MERKAFSFSKLCRPYRKDRRDRQRTGGDDTAWADDATYLNRRLKDAGGARAGADWAGPGKWECSFAGVTVVFFVPCAPSACDKKHIMPLWSCDAF